MTTFASLELARRLETAEALNGEACAESQQRLHPEAGAAVLRIAGGSAVFVGAGSPLSQAVGFGLDRPVRFEEIEAMEAFYGTHRAPVRVELCPLADPSLVEQLGQRRYCVTEFNNVLVRRMEGAAIPPAETSVRLAGPDEGDLWALTVGRGFLEKDTLDADEMNVGHVISHMRDARCYLAHSGGQAAAAGALAVYGGVAVLFADSTVTGFRGAGLQGALIAGRLHDAASSGCELATAATLPGSPSQRNYERHGFQVVYTRVSLVQETTS